MRGHAGLPVEGLEVVDARTNRVGGAVEQVDFAVADLRQDSQPALAISVIMVDILAPITPGSDVLEGISEFKTSGRDMSEFWPGCDIKRPDPGGAW